MQPVAIGIAMVAVNFRARRPSPDPSVHSAAEPVTTGALAYAARARVLDAARKVAVPVLAHVLRQTGAVGAYASFPLSYLIVHLPVLDLCDPVRLHQDGLVVQQRFG